MMDVVSRTLGDFHLPTKVSAEYVRDEPLWVVDLNTGERVYREQVDGMDDSWKRLKQYLSENPQQYITGLYFRFRDHWEEIARDKEAFFFTNFILCHYGGKEQYSFVGGYLNDDKKLHIKRFSIPELILDKEEYRDTADLSVQDGLIWRMLT